MPGPGAGRDPVPGTWKWVRDSEGWQDCQGRRGWKQREMLRGEGRAPQCGCRAGVHLGRPPAEVTRGNFSLHLSVSTSA